MKLYVDTSIKGLIELEDFVLLDVMPKEFMDAAGPAPITETPSFRTIL
jgi:hypothetical protein